MVKKEDFIFKVKNLQKSFGDKSVLNGLNLKVRRGEILGILGKSGAGKSTLMNIIIGSIKKYSGSVECFLEPNKKTNLKDAKNHIGFSFQPYSFYEELSLKENLQYFGKLYGLSKQLIRSRTEELFRLTDLDLEDLKIPVKKLSGGMKKRFDIVISLLQSPMILILDEPTAGLDPLRRKDIINILKRINKDGVTVMITSHIMSDIDGVVDRVLIIENGKSVLIAKPQDIKHELLDNEQILIESSPGHYDNIIRHLKAFSILHCEVEKDNLLIYTPESEIFIHYLMHLFEQEDEAIERITITEPDLSEVFDKLGKLGHPTVLKDNVNKLNKFIKSLIGKNYSSTKIKEIMRTHNWPDEVTKSLIDKQVNKKVKR